MKCLMHLLKLSPENLKIMNKKKYIYWFSCVLLTIALVAFDQFTKYIAVDKLKDNDPFVIFNGIFELFYVENKGAAYGIQGEYADAIDNMVANNNSAVSVDMYHVHEYFLNV